MEKIGTDIENVGTVFYFEMFCKRRFTKSGTFLLINLGYYGNKEVWRKNMKINSKTKELYDYIIKNPNRRIKEISGDLRINERKVRYEIGNLNFLLSVNRIKSRILNIDGNIKLEESSETMNFDNLLNSIEKLSMESRRDLILLKLLLNDLININKLSRELGGCSWKFSFTVK